MDKKNEKVLEQMHNNSIDILGNYENQEFLDGQFISMKSSEDVFPWLTNFNKLMCSSVGSKGSQLLERLLSLYTENILSSINTYCDDALNMIKLKNHISNTLTFFHLYWRDVKEYISDCDSYLNGMSALLGIYIDMELKTFRHTKDFSSIAAKLLSALWIYLDNSEKHIFRVLLKLKLITKKYVEICEPVLRKCFTNLRRKAESLTDIDYVRYLLILKMWKKIKGSPEEKKKVNKVALTILGPRAPTMRDELSKIIPKSLVEQENETLWLLQPYVFDLKTACSNFLAIEDKMSILCKDFSSLKTSDLNNVQKSQIFSSCDVNHIQECVTNYELNENETCNFKNNHSTRNTIDSRRSVDQNFSTKKRSKFKKHRKSKLKPGEVILIDLTEDDVSLKINKSNDKKRKLEWLKMMKKKCKVRKQVDEVKCRSQVEIADAHSTENSENSLDKDFLEYLPISDNKVSESTESCSSVRKEPLQDNTRYIRSQDTHDYICNKKNKQLKCLFQHKACENCVLSLKQDDTQSSRVLSLLKLLNVIGQNIKEPNDILNLFREISEQNEISSQNSSICRNAIDETIETNAQCKEELFSETNNFVETILLSKECQNSIINTQPIKQELPTSTNCNIKESDYCRNASVCVQSHLQDFRSVDGHSSQTTEVVRQKISCNAHECTSCCKKTEAKPFFCHNYSAFNATKGEDAMQNKMDDNTVDKKSICNKNIICMLSDLDKCMDVLNRIGEYIMTVHAEKQRFECSDKTDACAVSTTVFGDRISESSVNWAQIHSLANSEKLSNILELCERKDILNSCNFKDCYVHDNGETTAMLNLLKYESDNCKKLMISKSQSKKLHCYGKDYATFSENKLYEGVICNHVKSKLEQSIKQENSKCFEGTDETCSSKSLVYDLNNPDDKKNEDTSSDIVLGNFTRKSHTKSRPMDEFENIDILDSILNGDITMEDKQEILENSQTSSMSPIDYDNSNNVLNCISEFFLQSDQICTDEKEEKYIASYVGSSSTPLPEGSLGTARILNSLLDFELTNMDSLPNDFTYSTVQTVNPRLIKKSFEGEICSTKNEPEFNSQEEVVTSEKMILQKEEKFVDDSVGLKEFKLNTCKGEAHEFPYILQNYPRLSVNPIRTAHRTWEVFHRRYLKAVLEQ